MFFLAACGSSAAPATIRGTFTPAGEAASLFGGVAQYGACASETPAPGTQITVADPSGKVIGTGTLGTWSRASVKASGLTLYTCAMPFTITGVPPEPRYGFSVNGITGTIWKTSLTNIALSAASAG